jgi:hypothetical protein
MSIKTQKSFYRVRFMTKDDVKPVEVVVKRVASSEFLGLIMLEDFVFSDVKQHVVLPSEDKVRRQYTETRRLHIPYHNILSIEEFIPNKVDIKNLPFIRSAEDPELPEI